MSILSKFSNRDALKNLQNLNTDCQYAYQVGTELFKGADLNSDQYTALCEEFKRICDDISVELEAIKVLASNR